MRFVQIDEHGVGVFSQRPMNEFCGCFAELVDCNVHPKNEFDFVAMVTPLNSRDGWLVYSAYTSIASRSRCKPRQRNKQRLSKYGLL